MSGSTTMHEAAFPKKAASFYLRIPLGACLGFLAALSVLLSIDVAQDCSWSANGPGLTFDEGLNIEGGVYFTELTLRSGLGALHPGTLYDIFNDPAYHPDYPPLGRLPAALSNAVLCRLLGTDGHTLYVVTYARAGTALVFGLLIALVTTWTQRRCGTVAGLIAGISLWLTPRIFGHAHLASVETMMNLSYAGCVLLTLGFLAQRDSLRPRDGIWPGILLGLALLTKIQAIFLPPVIAAWILWQWRRSGILPLIVLAVASFVVFLIGWPWLWGDPLPRFIQYFSQATNRVTLYCYYFGHRCADKAVPWHYPFVMFLVTTPIPILLLGIWGMASRRKATPSTPDSFRRPELTWREHQLLLGVFWLPLITFALPGVAVYDGERLFLVVWPIFAIWAGIAGQQLFDALSRRWNQKAATGVLVLLLLSPLSGIMSVRPCELSYYNGLVGGLSGASQLGLEPTYWGDSLTPAFLEQVSSQLPESATVGVAPILHPLYLEGLKKDSWLRHRPDLNLVPFDDKRSDAPRLVFVIRRLGDPWDALINKPEGTKTLGAVTRQSVPLAELLLLPDPSAKAP